MYAIMIKNDNTVKTLVNQSIYRGFKLPDWFWIFVKPYYNNTNMWKYTAIIQFILPFSKKTITEKIILKDEVYKGFLKYSLSSKSKITKESGIVLAKVIFIDSDGNIVRETSEFKISIAFNNSFGNINSESDNGCNCCCNNEEHIKEIMSEIKPLIFESVNDAETKINSGEISNLYYGQSIIIKNDNKYLLYTIQKGNNGYVVEPVDTDGNNTNEGLFWQESN